MILDLEQARRQGSPIDSRAAAEKLSALAGEVCANFAIASTRVESRNRMAQNRMPKKQPVKVDWASARPRAVGCVAGLALRLPRP